MTAATTIISKKMSFLGSRSYEQIGNKKKSLYSYIARVLAEAMNKISSKVKQKAGKKMVVYEMARFPFPMEGLIEFIMVVACFFFVVVYVEKYLKKKKWRYLVASIVLVAVNLFLAWMFVFSVKEGGSENYKYAREYYAGNYYTVKGMIRNFQSENVNGYICKSFYVDDIYFQQRCTALNWNEMFHRERTIFQDGQNVEICYVEDGDRKWDEHDESGNIIVKIFLLDYEKSNNNEK